MSLNPPDNYFGATRVFVEDAERVVHTVDDHADLLPLKHRIDHRVTVLPETLKTAVRVIHRCPCNPARSWSGRRAQFDAGERFPIHECADADTKRDPPADRRKPP